MGGGVGAVPKISANIGNTNAIIKPAFIMLPKLISTFYHLVFMLHIDTSTSKTINTDMVLIPIASNPINVIKNMPAPISIVRTSGLPVNTPINISANIRINAINPASGVESATFLNTNKPLFITNTGSKFLNA